MEYDYEKCNCGEVSLTTEHLVGIDLQEARVHNKEKCFKVPKDVYLECSKRFYRNMEENLYAKELFKNSALNLVDFTDVSTRFKFHDKLPDPAIKVALNHINSVVNKKCPEIKEIPNKIEPNNKLVIKYR